MLGSASKPPQAQKRKTIPSIGPSITELEISLVTEAVTKGWYENMGLHLDQFTKEFSAFTGLKYCLPVSHCSAAIHLAMIALKIGPGDEVIVPDITWVASAAPVTYLGATPVFVDIDPIDWCISPEAFERAITKRTKAVIVVDLLGNMPRMNEIRAIAKAKKIKIIEDAAEAIGAEYHGEKAGTLGDLNVFSFNATKLTIAGQGGVIGTNNKKYFDRYKLFAHHGINKKPGGKYYWSDVIGFNYNWTNIQAALALAQLRRLDELLAKKDQIFSWYRERIGNIDGIQLNTTPPGIKNSHWLINVMLSGRFRIRKEKVKNEFHKYNVDVRPFFYPISSMPPYKKYTKGRNMAKYNPVSYKLSPYGVSLPSGMNLTEPDVDYVCKNLLTILQEQSRKR